jgi:bacillithiol system protein YtxJ
MSGAQPLRSREDLEALLASTARRPALVFKHSTACPISARAYREWEQFLTRPAAAGVTCAWVRVIEERPVSLALAQRVGVPHQSPQALLIRDGRALWHDSHHRITADALEAAVRAAARDRSPER